MRRHSLPRPSRIDLLIAGGMTVFLVAGTPFVPRGQGIEVPLDRFGYLLLVVSGLVLAFRRLAPVTVVVVSSAITVTYYAYAYPGFFQPTAMFVALYTAAALGRRWVALTAGVVVCFGIAVIAMSLTSGRLQQALDAPLWIVGWLAAVIAAAEIARQRSAYLAEVEQRAADALRTREETARRRATEERLRIARELHDTLTHAISLVNVQAGVALHLKDRDPDQAHQALQSVRESSKQAMQELRSTLHLLRGTDDTATSCPSLTRLSELVEATRQPGMAVDLRITGTPRELPSDIDRAGYRIVQESLTNAIRHARPDQVVVQVDYRPDDVTVRIDNNGLPLSAETTIQEGRGIRGMRERVRSISGELDVRTGTDGEFHVVAVLPNPREGTGTGIDDQGSAG